MWWLWNKLFGWDYIHWTNSADRGIARIHKDDNNVVWYWRYKTIKIIDKILDKNQVIWLTCKPEKYLDTRSNDAEIENS